MTMLHFANCTALTYVPLWIVYKCSGLGDGDGFRAMMRAAACFLGSQMVMMILLASFIPDMDNKSRDLTQELMKIVIAMIEIVAMSLTYQFAMRGERTEKVLALGLGWATAESALMRFFPLWFGARQIEFEWTWIAMAVEANLSIAVYIAFARLISRYHTKNDDPSAKAQFLQVLGAAALVHGGLGSRASTLQGFSLLSATAVRCTYTTILWLVASHVFSSRPRSAKSA